MAPRETVRTPVRLAVVRGGLAAECTVRDDAVRVALSGTLDRSTLRSVRRRVEQRLWRRGLCVELDGRRLRHVDYRAAGDLLAWHRDLKAYGHRLLLVGWSRYLRTILVLGWGGEPAVCRPDHRRHAGPRP